MRETAEEALLGWGFNSSCERKWWRRERNLYFALSIYYLRVYAKNNPDMLIDFTHCFILFLFFSFNFPTSFVSPQILAPFRNISLEIIQMKWANHGIWARLNTPCTNEQTSLRKETKKCAATFASVGSMTAGLPYRQNTSVNHIMPVSKQHLCTTLF